MWHNMEEHHYRNRKIGGSREKQMCIRVPVATPHSGAGVQLQLHSSSNRNTVARNDESIYQELAHTVLDRECRCKDVDSIGVLEDATRTSSISKVHNLHPMGNLLLKYMPIKNKSMHCSTTS